MTESHVAWKYDRGTSFVPSGIVLHDRYYLADDKGIATCFEAWDRLSGDRGLSPKLAKAKSMVEKATLLAGLREKAGCFGRCKYDPEKGFRIEEYHHPLQRIFDKYPRAITMELRAIEQSLGTKVVRKEIPGGRAGPARVDFEISTLGTR